MSKAQAVGLFVLEQESRKSSEKTPTPSVDIVAVHGLNGDRVKSWTYMDSKTKEEIMWLIDLLPNRVPNVRVMTFGYNSDTVGIISAAGIRKQAINLLMELQSKRTPEQENRPIVFIGHSFGGVIIKQIFFGVPHRAADVPSWENITFNIAATSFGSLRLRELFPNGTEIDPKHIIEISEEFDNFAGKYSILSFYELANAPLLGSVAVGKYSATLDIASEEKISLDGDHLAMSKFSKDGGKGFELLCEKIKQAGKTGTPMLNEKYIGCLKALSALSSELSLSKTSLPHPGTFDWMVSHGIYCEWLNSRVPAILLLKGQSGVGKTVLSSFLRKSLRTASLTPMPTVAYFSCDCGDQRRRSARKLLISLIHQLLFLKPSLFLPVKRLYQLANDYSFWTNEKLWAFFRSILLFCPEDERIICIIDALDECDSSRAQLLSNLIKLRSATGCTFKIIITSQPHFDICGPLELGFAIDLASEAGIQAGLGDFIKSGVSDLVQKTPFYAGFEQNIVEMLHQPDTTFLIATLTLDRLAALRTRSAPTSIKNGLESLQCDLTILCERTLQDIPSESRPWARNALVWILYAFRPMKVHQLAIALAIENDSTLALIDNNIPLDMIGDLKRMFGPLVQIRNDDVRLVHQSARESFLSLMAQSESDWYMDERLAHLIIAQSCLTYLSMEKFGDGPSFVDYSHGGSPKLAIPQTREHELLTYAAKYWPAHHQQASNTLHSHQERVGRFLGQKKQARVWSELHWFLEDARRDRISGSPLQIASELGLVGVVGILLDKVVEDPATSRMDRMMALSLAAQNGHLALVEQLLEAGTEVGPTVNNITALHMASEEGHELIVEKLISAGADVSAVDDAKSTPLHLAAKNGNLAVVNILIKAKADVNAVDGAKLTPSHLAARSGNTALVGELLGAGADIEPKLNSPTALHMAAEEGHEAVVKMLINAKSDVSAVDETKRTPLHLAAQNGYSAVVKLLLMVGAYEDEIDGTESTPLHLAAQHGQLAVVRELLKAVADMNAANDTGATPLHLAAHGGYAAVVKVLLEAGSDIEKKTRLGWTPLHSAFLNITAVELLLKFGADVHAQNNLGSGPLTVAAGGGSQEVVKLFLHVGADPRAMGNDGSTPLHRAAEGGHLEIVEILLDVGADPWARVWEGEDEKFPLRLVGAIGNENVVKVLKSAMEYRKRAEGENNGDLSSMEQSVWVYRNESWWEKAEELGSHVLETSTKAFGEEHPKTLENMANLAMIRFLQERFREAENLQLKVLEASERVLGAEHLDSLKSMTSLAFTYLRLERWKEAEELEEKVLKRSGEKFGVEHLATVTSMNRMVWTKLRLGQFSEAETLATEASEISARVFGEDHPKTLEIYKGLAGTYWNQGRFDRAESLGTKLLEKSRRVFGDEHVETLGYMRNLAITYRSQNRLEEQEKLLLQALEISKRALGGSGYLPMQVMVAIVSHYFKQERWTDVEELQLQVLEQSKKCFGEDHPRALEDMARLAYTYKEQGRFLKAEEFGLQAFELSKKAIGDDHPDTLQRMMILSWIYLEGEKYEKSVDVGMQALEKSRAILGEEDSITIAVAEDLVSSLWSLRRWAEIDPILLQLLATLKTIHGEENQSVLEKMEHLSLLYQNQQRHKEEEDTQVQVVALSKKIYGERHPDTLANMTNLASFYRRQGWEDEAQKLENLISFLELSASSSDVEAPGE